MNRLYKSVKQINSLSIEAIVTERIRKSDLRATDPKMITAYRSLSRSYKLKDIKSDIQRRSNRWS